MAMPGALASAASTLVTSSGVEVPKPTRVHPLAVPEVILALDVWVMLAATGLLCVFAISGWRISRREGLLMMAGYAVYTGYLISHA